MEKRGNSMKKKPLFANIAERLAMEIQQTDKKRLPSITELALRRTETRGVHNRGDYPETDPAWARHQTVRRASDEVVVE